MAFDAGPEVYLADLWGKEVTGRGYSYNFTCRNFLIPKSGYMLFLVLYKISHG